MTRILRVPVFVVARLVAALSESRMTRMTQMTRIIAFAYLNLLSQEYLSESRISRILRVPLLVVA